MQKFCHTGKISRCTVSKKGDAKKYAANDARARACQSVELQTSRASLGKTQAGRVRKTMGCMMSRAHTRSFARQAKQSFKGGGIRVPCEQIEAYVESDVGWT